MLDNLANKRVLIRLDLNVPMSNGQVRDTTRLTRSLPTMRHLISQKARIIVLSHFGRPKKPDPTLSMRPIAEALATCLGQPVRFVSECVGQEVEQAIAVCKPGEVIMLENLRFHEEEEKNDPTFSKQLAALGDVYINEAFSCSHRAHASVVGITNYLPAYPGFALQQEVQMLEKLLISPQHPLMAIIGGSKVSTKLDLLNNLLKKVDYLVIGGGMANTFLKAQGHDVSKSLVELDLVDQAKTILKACENEGCTVLLPTDVRVTESLKEGCFARMIPLKDLKPTEMIADIGDESAQCLVDAITQCKTIVWNGPVGVFEIPPFDTASHRIAKAIADRPGILSVAGGGDTLACIDAAGYTANFTYLSTAGGAFLEWLEGKILPGIEALKKP